ncbi:unnamed protein product, partial [Polarella glacialis]
VDAVMVGRAAYEQPFAWAQVDELLLGAEPRAEQPKPSAVVRGLMPYADAQLASGQRLWAVARHLVKLLQGVPGAREWRHQLCRAETQRDAGMEVLERAASELEALGY